MSKLNISEASRATGKARSTIKRHITRGKLSAEQDALGNRVLDISELQRVYGEVDLESAGGAQQNGSTIQQEPPQIRLLDHELEVMRVKLEAAERAREASEKEKDRLLGIIEVQTKQLAAPTEMEHKQAGKKGFWGRLFGA